MKAIFGYFQQFGWAALFSLSVQKAAAGERFEVVDGSHRYAVARLIVDPNRVSELPAHITQDERQELRDLAMNLNKEYPKVKNAPQLYSLTNPDLPARLKPALKALHFPDSKDAYIKLTKIVGLCSVEQLTALSQTPIQSHLTRSNLWRIFETKDVLFNQFLIARMLQPDFNGSTLATPDLPKFKLPIRQAEQAWLLMARHDEAALARHEPHPLLLLPPDEPTRKILLGKLFQLPEFEYFNPLLVRPLPTKLGHPVLPEYSEELGAVGCPFSGLNWDDLVHLPNYILDLNIFDGPHLPGELGRPPTPYELAVGYWMAFSYARLPHGTRRYLINTKLTVLVEKLTADHVHPRREMKLLKTIDRNLREAREAARERERQERLEREVEVSALVAKLVGLVYRPVYKLNVGFATYILYCGFYDMRFICEQYAHVPKDSPPANVSSAPSVSFLHLSGCTSLVQIAPFDTLVHPAAPLVSREGTNPLPLPRLEKQHESEKLENKIVLRPEKFLILY
ncbi:hypothetical protein PAPYR_12081 [Paratrimastix pyriformis]|uniref:ParB/Sulfiredoxin domain-containing protein n=1 Tax=Paratrimastix pyriformis TaxID=342808 RepID=A0ABQ8U2I2_9EUKA|nr:hypothetical protein PAPYR_12081 [Paratrimastix pyriformis]